MNLTQTQKIFAMVVGGVVLLAAIVGIYFAFIKTDTPKPTIKPATPTYPPTPTYNPTYNPTYTPTINPITNVPEVYYADKGGTNETRYAIKSIQEAEAYATSLGGTLATLQQIQDAQRNGLDICSFAWAKDGKIYTATSTPNSDQTCGTPGIYDYSWVKKGGVWVYGVKKPKIQSTDCAGSGITVPCLLPFSKTKWSNY